MNGVTDRMDINQLLAQMREIRGNIQSPAVRPDALAGTLGAGQSPTGVAASEPGSFGQVLKQAVDSVNETQQKSAALQRAFEMGDPQVDITQVMIQMQKASVSFEAMNQVRNRLVSAYQDIMNMPI